MQFLLQVREQGGAFELWTGHAVVTLDKDSIQLFLQRRELLQMVRARDTAADELHFLGNMAFILEDDVELESILNEEQLEKYNEEEQLLLPPDDEVDEHDIDFQGTECDMTIIDDVGVRFGFLLDQCVGQVQTETITHEELLEMLKTLSASEKPSKSVG